MSKRQYEFSIKSLGLFAALIAATTIGVSLIYGGLYGFTYMGQELTGAARVMTAAAAQPMTQGLHPMGGGQGGLPMGTGQGQGAGQYLCPQHGAAGTPTFDANGTPLCPLDGQPMRFFAANAAPIR